VQVSGADIEGPWVRILDESEDYRFGGLFRVVRAKLQYRRFDGQFGVPVQRISFERGDSVGVLLYDPDRDVVILVRQFRFPVYAGLDPDSRSGDGARQAWLLEIVAGVRDEDLTVREVAHKELLEEAGYLVEGALEPIASIYASPGGSSERIHLFLASVKADSAIASGGGTATEGEDTQVVVVSVADAMKMVAKGEIQDAKTVIALQYLALQRVRG
jgi:ADP-ribose pyrophosphatase